MTERTIVVRHGLRNALIPLATIVAIDVGAILGGAVITETVFEWNAMGRMFTEGLNDLDPNRVMAFFVVIAIFAVVANLLADLTTPSSTRDPADELIAHVTHPRTP